jgi:DNA-binding beta-propeller fold protein YncE
VDPWGYVYVTDLGNNRVQKFDSSGNFISKFGSLGTGDGQFWNPRGIGIDAAGNIYVADTLRHRVQKLTNSGTFVIKWGDHGSHDGEFQDPFGIAVDQSGNVYVDDAMNVRIQKFSQGAPVANAGADQTFTCVKTPTQAVTLNASGTTDPTPGDAATLEYEWRKEQLCLALARRLPSVCAGTHRSLAVTTIAIILPSIRLHQCLSLQSCDLQMRRSD